MAGRKVSIAGWACATSGTRRSAESTKERIPTQWWARAPRLLKAENDAGACGFLPAGIAREVEFRHFACGVVLAERVVCLHADPDRIGGVRAGGETALVLFGGFDCFVRLVKVEELDVGEIFQCACCDLVFAAGELAIAFG